MTTPLQVNPNNASATISQFGQLSFDPNYFVESQLSSYRKAREAETELTVVNSIVESGVSDSDAAYGKIQLQGRSDNDYEVIINLDLSGLPGSQSVTGGTIQYFYPGESGTNDTPGLIVLDTQEELDALSQVAGDESYALFTDYWQDEQRVNRVEQGGASWFGDPPASIE